MEMTQRWTRNRRGEVSSIVVRPMCMITYTIPMRPGVRAQVILPSDLSEREAARFCAIVKTLAFSDEELAS